MRCAYPMRTVAGTVLAPLVWAVGAVVGFSVARLATLLGPRAETG
jgi:hypothetical protein